MGGIYWVAGTSWYHHLEVRVENITCVFFTHNTNSVLLDHLRLWRLYWHFPCLPLPPSARRAQCWWSWDPSQFLNHAVFMKLWGKGHWTILIIYSHSRYFPLPLSPLDNLSERFYLHKEKEWWSLVIRLRPHRQGTGETGAITPRYALLPSLCC